MSKKCPECGDIYESPMSKEEASNKGKEIIIEQYITGLCSRECFLRHLGSLLEYESHSDNLPKDKRYKDKVDLLTGIAENSKYPTYLTVEKVDEGEIKERLVDALLIETNGGEVDLDKIVHSFENVSNRKELNNLLEEKIAYIEK